MNFKTITLKFNLNIFFKHVKAFGIAVIWFQGVDNGGIQCLDNTERTRRGRPISRIYLTVSLLRSRCIYEYRL